MNGENYSEAPPGLESGPPPPTPRPVAPMPIRERVDQAEFDPLKLVVDTDTGEILDGSHNQFAIEDLARVGRGVIAIKYDISQRKANTAAECERLMEHCDQQTRALDKQVDFMLNRANILLEASGQKKITFPGIATFALHEQPSKVDRTEYDDMEEQAQKALRVSSASYYVTSTPKPTTKPDMKKILADLKAGEAIPGFKLNIKGRKLVFTPEVHNGN